MKTTATLTTIAAMAVAGAAVACESTCEKKTKTLELTAAPAAPVVVETAEAPVVIRSAAFPESVHVVTVGDHGDKGESLTLKIEEKDGEIRFWINGEEVDEAKFKAASGKVRKAAEARRAKRAIARVDRSDRRDNERVYTATVDAFKPRLGVVLGEVSDDLAEKIDVDSDNVILIERVIDGTPAAKAGLKSYDVLLEFDGEDDLDVTKLRKLIAKQKPGGVTEAVVIRDGDVQEFEVVFEHKGKAFVVAPDAPEPPRPGKAEPAPRARFFGARMDEAKKVRLEEAMRLAEKYSERAQAQAERWAKKAEKQAIHLEKLGNKLEMRFDDETRAEFEAAMEELEDVLADHDIDFDFEINFDSEDFPRFQFIELDDAHDNRAAVLERKLRKQAEHHARVEERVHAHEQKLREREHEIRQRHRDAQREREHKAHRNDAEREIAQLQDRIHELESMVEALVEQIEEMKDRPRGVRN